MGPHPRRSRLVLLASVGFSALLFASGCTTYAGWGGANRCSYGRCSYGRYDPYSGGGYYDGRYRSYGYGRYGPSVGARPYPVYVPVYRDWDDDRRKDRHRHDGDRKRQRDWDREHRRDVDRRIERQRDRIREHPHVSVPGSGVEKPRRPAWQADRKSWRDRRDDVRAPRAPVNAPRAPGSWRNRGR